MNVKEFSFSCVSLFSYQDSCRSFLSATAFILYQSCFCLSRTFLTFFKVFYFDLLSFSATAIIEYHIFISLSIVFYFYFFKLFKTILTTNQQFVLYNIIIIHHLSTAFFTFFQFFSTILDSMNFQAFTTIKTAVNAKTHRQYLPLSVRLISPALYKQTTIF